MANDKQEEKQRKPRAKEIPWAKNQVWTHAVITRLLEDPILRRNTFSESTAEAKADGRSKAKFGKSSKSVYFEELAQGLFGEEDPLLKIDAERVEDFKKDPKRYGQSVRSHFASLKKSYVEYAARLGKTGNGLRPEEVTAGSKLANIIDEIRKEWPFWDNLHAIWREMPNYVPPCVVSSDADLDPGAAFDRALMREANADGEEEDGEQDGSDAEVGEKEDGDEDGRIEGWFQTPQKTPQRRSSRIATAESAKASPAQIADSSSPTAPKSNTKLTPNKKEKTGVAAKGGRTASKRNHLDAFGERQKEESKRLATLDNLLYKEKIAALDFQTAKLRAQDKERQRRHEAAQADRKAQERRLEMAHELAVIQARQFGTFLTQLPHQIPAVSGPSTPLLSMDTPIPSPMMSTLQTSGAFDLGLNATFADDSSGVPQTHFYHL